MDQDIKDRIWKLSDYLDTDEGRKGIREFIEREVAKENIEATQIRRFNEKHSHDFDAFMENIRSKYESENYRGRWYGRGIEPPEDLYWFAYEYAMKYGREATTEEYKQYGNMFTANIYFIHGFYFNRMDGQGSVIKIHKSESTNPVHLQ